MRTCDECGNRIPICTYPTDQKALCNSCRYPETLWYGNPHDSFDEISGNMTTPREIAQMFDRAYRQISERSYLKGYLDSETQTG